MSQQQKTPGKTSALGFPEEETEGKRGEEEAERKTGRKRAAQDLSVPFQKKKTGHAGRSKPKILLSLVKLDTLVDDSLDDPDLLCRELAKLL